MPGKRIGVDESGKGDFFGPLVVAVVYVGPEHVEKLSDVKDAKKLKDDACLRLDELIRETCPFEVVAIGPAKYNELFDKTRHLNTILAWGYAKGVESVRDKVECDDVMADIFPDAPGLIRHFGEKGIDLRLTPKINADADLAVAAASVIARAEYIRRLQSLSTKAGVKFPKGANANAVEAGAEVVKKMGKEVLKQVAKLHFKTSQQVLKKARGF